MQTKGRLGILVVGLFAAIAGIGEIVVGFTGNYLGILSHPIAPSMATAIIGGLYSLGGLFILTMRKWGAAIGVFFIGAEVLGRIYLVAIGIAPSSGPDAMKIAIGHRARSDRLCVVAVACSSLMGRAVTRRRRHSMISP